ncbi:hypothetical protein [Bacillus sp. JCM 19034]|uniref:hypothetical protein n=1 Tax=Bacillus sp. JCM 19034 TaxID=1481928 RepID=UPI00078100EF|nr:hypothetical protein [Bacillus sp. JCM 19034]
MRMKLIRKFFFSIIVCIIIGSSFLSEVSFAEGELPNEEMETGFMERESVLDEKYSSYLSKIESVYVGDDIVLDQMGEIVSDSSDLTMYEGEEVIKVERNKDVTLRINAPEDNDYKIALKYLIDDENVLPTQLSLRVNGETPYYELRNLIFESKWASPDTIPLDKYGNEIVPQPYKVYEWQDKFLVDSSYRSSEPLLIPLEKGDNKLTLSVQEGNLLIKELRLVGQENLDNYEYSEASGNQMITIQGENIMYRNDSSIRAGAAFNIDLEPYHSSKRVLNFLDDSSFKNAGQKVSYEFEVEEAGFYYLGMNYRQRARDDFPVFIHILINDEIPVAEYQNYPLDYTTEFKVHTVTDFESDTPIPIYLEEGLNTLSFVISLDPLKETIEAVEQLIYEIQLLSLELNNLAGPNADRHRDINVEEFIPGVTEQLITC